MTLLHVASPAVWRSITLCAADVIHRLRHYCLCKLILRAARATWRQHRDEHRHSWHRQWTLYNTLRAVVKTTRTEGTSDWLHVPLIHSPSLSTLTMKSGLHPWTPSRPHRFIHFVCLPSVWLTNLCRCRIWRITVSRTTARTTVEKQVLCHYFLCAIMNTFMRTCIHMLVYLLPNSSEKRLCFKCSYHIRNCQNNLPPTEGPDLQSLLHTLDRRQRISELKPHSEDLHCDRHWLSCCFFITATDLRTHRPFVIRRGGTFNMTYMIQSIREVMWTEYYG